jgi:hypothetical protein
MVDTGSVKTMERLENLNQEIEVLGKTIADLTDRLGPFLLPCGPDGSGMIGPVHQGSMVGIGIQEAIDRVIRLRDTVNELSSRVH